MKYSSSSSSLDCWDLAPGEAISQSPPIRAAESGRTPFCPAPTLDTEEFLAQNACSEDCSSVDSMADFDLASGEARSQSPLGNFYGSQLLQCPPPTLDTQEFLAHNAYGKDCSSVDSMADFDLAPGEARSQSPLGDFYGSQLLRCPPPTLDTQEFENNLESQGVWIVEDSLACSDLAQGECRSPGPVLDMPSIPDQFWPPSLGSKEFEKSSIISDDVWLVEDSLACWDRAPAEAPSEGALSQCNDFKSLGFPSSVDVLGCATDDKEQGSVPLSPFTPVNCCLQAGDGTKIGSNLLVRPSPAGKRSLPSTSQYGSSGNSHKHVKLDPGCNFSNDSNNRILRKQILEVAKLTKHTLSETIPPAMSNVQAAVTNFEDGSYKTSFVTRFAPMDVTDSRVSAAGSPTKSNSDFLRCLLESYEAISANNAEDVTTLAEYSKNSAVSESHEQGQSTEVDAKSVGQKTGCGGQSTAKVQTSLDFEPLLVSLDHESANSRKLVKPNIEGWLCPRDGKKFVPTSKQLSLDRWIVG
ncbi:unnamed protein product [Calypogeia fissa]